MKTTFIICQTFAAVFCLFLPRGVIGFNVNPLTGCEAVRVRDWDDWVSSYDEPESSEAVPELSVEEELIFSSFRVSITCSNVPPLLNYFSFTELFDFRNYKDQVLTITNSIIPTLRANNSLHIFPSIKKLVLEKQGIEEIESGAFDNLKTLRNLNLNQNHVKRIQFGVFNSLKRLTILSISGNSIEEIAQNAFQGMVKLKTIFLNNNKLKVLPENLFKGLDNLRYLDVSSNPLRELHDPGFGSVEAIIMEKTELRNVDVDFSKLNLTKMRWAENQLQEIDFAKMPRGSSILLSHNKIRVVRNWGQIGDGTLLDLAFNNLTYAELPAKVISVSFSQNQIKNLTKSVMPKILEVLKLDHNNFENITHDQFLGLQNLRELQLSFNRIVRIDNDSFTSMPNLVELGLKDNLLQKILPGTFDALPKLKVLDLSNNKIEELEGVLHGMEGLENLRVDSNHLLRIEFSGLPQLKMIWLNQNSFICSDLMPALFFLQVRQVEVKDRGSWSGDDNINGVSCVHKHAKR